MATVKIDGFMHARKGFDGELEFNFFAFNDASSVGYVLVGPHSFTYDVPEEFDPVASEVAALNKQLEKVTEAHQQEVRRIKGRIAELLAIAYDPQS